MAISAFPYTAVLDVSANSLLGNNTGSTAAAIALTATQVRTLLSVYTSAQVDALLAGKSDTGHTHAASDITSGTIATARLASGTASASTYLRGDQTWATVSAGISSLNGLTDATQTFAVGTTGTDVAFSSASGVHTLNIPDASSTARGVVTTGTQSFAGIKTFESGRINGGTTNQWNLNNSSSALNIQTNQGTLSLVTSGGTLMQLVSADPQVRFTSNIRFGTFGNDVTFSPDAQDIMAQRRGTNAQATRIYNTYTSATSFERLNIGWSGNVCTIETDKGSAGGTLRGLKIGGAITSLLGFYGATPVDQPDTVADPTGGGTIDTEARTAINAIIDRLQELGLIA